VQLFFEIWRKNPVIFLLSKKAIFRNERCTLNFQKISVHRVDYSVRPMSSWAWAASRPKAYTELERQNTIKTLWTIIWYKRACIRQIRTDLVVHILACPCLLLERVYCSTTRWVTVSYILNVRVSAVYNSGQGAQFDEAWRGLLHNINDDCLYYHCERNNVVIALTWSTSHK